MIKFITKELIKNGQISEEDEEIYSFGLKQGFIMVAIWGIILLVGIFMGMVLQTIAFSATFIFLRMYSGGFHLSTQSKCSIASIIIVFFMLEVVKNFDFTLPVIGVVCAISIITLLIIGPVEDKNKPFEDDEKQIFSKKMMMVLGVEVIVLILFSYFKLYTISASITLALFTEAILVVIGLAKNKIEDSRIKLEN